MKTKAKFGQQWVAGCEEGRAFCDKSLGEMCYSLHAPTAVALIREMAVRMDTAMKTDASDPVAVGFMYRLAARAI